MRRLKLSTHLNRLGQLVARNVSSLNYGGCCVFASAVADELRKVTKSTKILVSDDVREVSSITEARNDMKMCNSDRSKATDWNRFGLYFAHVFVEFKEGAEKFYYDSNGVKKAVACKKSDPSFGYPVLAGHLTNKEARDISSRPDGWNWRFNHRDDAHRVRKLVQLYFAEHIHPANYSL